MAFGKETTSGEDRGELVTQKEDLQGGDQLEAKKGSVPFKTKEKTSNRKKGKRNGTGPESAARAKSSRGVQKKRS